MVPRSIRTTVITTAIQEKKQKEHEPMITSKQSTDHLGNVFPSRRKMCEYWHVSVKTFKKRLDNGDSIEDALTKPLVRKHMHIDHLGNEFSSLRKMCKYWHTTPKAFNDKRAAGMSIEDSLTKPMAKAMYKDHLGHEFDSVAAMCKHWNINIKTFQGRRSRGMTLKEALETPIASPRRNYNVKEELDKRTDHTGKVHKSVEAMCEFWGVSRRTYSRNVQCGKSKQEALTSKTSKAINCRDYLGNEFSSIRDMCRYHHVAVSTYAAKVKSGTWAKDMSVLKNAGVYDHQGNKFSTIKEMISYWCIPYYAWQHRQKADWDLERILTTPVYKNHYPCKDHQGRQFESFSEMCKYWKQEPSTVKSRLNNNWRLADALTCTFAHIPLNDICVATNIAKLTRAIDDIAHREYYLCEYDDGALDVLTPKDLGQIINNIQENVPLESC